MPRVKLDDRSIRTLTSQGRARLDYADLLMPGLRLRVTDRGAKSWSLLYRVKGDPRQKRRTYGPFPKISLAEAREMARSDSIKAGQGIDPQTAERKGPTVREVVAEYLARHVSKLKTAKNYQLMLERDVLPAWADRPIEELRRRDVVQLIDRIVDRGAPILANRTLAVIGSLFSWAIERGIIELNPAGGMSRPGKERTRETALPFDSLLKIWRAVENDDPLFAWYVRLRILTGKREAELMAMRWSQISGSWWDLPGAYTKTGKPDRVYVTGLFREALEALVPINGHREMVFASPRTKGALVALDPYVRRVAKRTGIAFTSRDLRAAFITQISEMGYPPHVVAALASHSLPGVTQKHYDRYSRDPEKQAAMLAWDGRLQAALRGEPGRILRMPHGSPATSG